MWEIEARKGPASLILVNAGIGPFPENHADVGTTHIPKSRVNAKTIRARANMLTVVRIPWRNGSPTMLQWTQ